MLEKESYRTHPIKSIENECRVVWLVKPNPNEDYIDVVIDNPGKYARKIIKQQLKYNKMKIVLSTESELSARTLKNNIIKSIQGGVPSVDIDTWSYKQVNKIDVIFHNPVQYIDNPEKNVVFSIKIDDSNVIFSASWWKENPRPLDELICLHTGRLTEMLLRYFKESFIKLVVLF